MLTNKIIHAIIAITGLIVIPIQMVTTFVLGMLVSASFGLLLLPISLIWVVLFLAPLFCLSYIYEHVKALRPFVAAVGIPLAVLGNTFVALMPAMGEMDSRFQKLILCQVFPYTWQFIQFEKGSMNVGEGDGLSESLKLVSRAKPLSKHLDRLRADVYSRPQYMNGTYRLDW